MNGYMTMFKTQPLAFTIMCLGLIMLSGFVFDSSSLQLLGVFLFVFAWDRVNDVDYEMMKAFGYSQEFCEGWEERRCLDYEIRMKKSEAFENDLEISREDIAVNIDESMDTKENYRKIKASAIASKFGRVNKPNWKLWEVWLEDGDWIAIRANLVKTRDNRV